MSREKILKRIAGNKPALSPLPEIPDFSIPVDDIVEAFKVKAEVIGCQLFSLQKLEDGKAIIAERFPEAKMIWSQVDALPLGTIERSQLAKRQDLKTLDVAIFEGQLGVAESAAVWLTEKELGLRVAGFITQHVVLCLDHRKIVWNMHQAYRQLQIDETGYGLWMAGPSKTGDIEQSLVLGAQGPRSLTVFLY